MSKKTEAPEEEVETEEAPKKKRGGRHIVIKDPDTGEDIKRVDFIRREVIDRGRTRREVTNQLCEIEGRDVQFQIVYAATKDYRPPKPQKKAEGEEAAAEE